MLETGDGLALLGGAIPITVALIKWNNWRKPKNNGVSEKLCTERHEVLSKRIDELKEESRNADMRVEKKIDDLSKNTNEILISINVLKERIKPRKDQSWGG